MLSQEQSTQLLALPSPWQVDKITINHTLLELTADISIHPASKGVLGKKARGECPVCGQKFPLINTGSIQCLRHVNFGLYHVYLRFQTPPILCHHQDKKCPFHLEAAPYLPFTHAFIAQIAAYSGTEQQNQQVCEIFGLGIDILHRLQQFAASKAPEEPVQEAAPLSAPLRTPQQPPHATPTTTAEEMHPQATPQPPLEELYSAAKYLYKKNLSES